MNQNEQMLGKERTGQPLQIVWAFLLFALLTGLWACLWVPPSPAL